ncbi:MAG: glycine hydroxymethyltransferase [Candidatus Paceibacteria bacterium]|jgi:glycine hydroxymethyltransferase
MKDKQIAKLLKNEKARQKKAINLIASENYVSKDVLEALGSEYTNKYAEGYSKARYYGGNQFVDELEDLVQNRARKLFKLSDKKWHVNVQSLSGTPANMAVFSALVPFGGKIMAMTLDSGGHLSHGYKVSITGKMWKQVPYSVDPDTEKINYDAVMRIAMKEKPQLIVAGFSAYSRKVNWKKFREIADSCGAILMVDMAHIAGLVAGGAHTSPFPYADIVTTTVHKTLRGPRAALIFSRKDISDYSDRIDKAVFPGMQGGPHMNQILSTAVALNEATQTSFKIYAKQVVLNAKALSDKLKSLGWRIVSGGTDNHIILIDVWGTLKIGGKEASEILEQNNIIVNKNQIPFDTRKPMNPSGVRLGTPAETTRGKKEKDFVLIAVKIDKILRAYKN